MVVCICGVRSRRRSECKAGLAAAAREVVEEEAVIAKDGGVGWSEEELKPELSVMLPNSGSTC